MNHGKSSFRNTPTKPSLSEPSYLSTFQHPIKSPSKSFSKSAMTDSDPEYCDQGCMDMTGATPKCPLNDNSQHQEILSMDQIVKALSGKVVEVEGNIGCGKSTLTKLMSKICNNYTQGITDEVTVDSLSKQNTTGSIASLDDSHMKQFSIVHDEMVNPAFLGAFYRDPERYGFAFQMYMLTTRLYQMQHASDLAKEKGHFALLDRGAVGDALFARHNSSRGNISEEEMGVYRSVCADRLPSSLSDKVDIVLYLDVSPDHCFDRMNNMRQRDAEKDIVPDYLYGIDDIYFDTFMKWLGHRDDACDGIDIGKPPAIVIVDWSEFGCAKTILNKIAHAALSIRDNNPLTGIKPRVEFMTGTPSMQLRLTSNYDTIETEDQLDALYDQLITFKNLYGRDGQPINHLLVDWSLPRTTDSFKRVCMKVIANGGALTFFNSQDDQPSH